MQSLEIWKQDINRNTIRSNDPFAAIISRILCYNHRSHHRPSIARSSQKINQALKIGFDGGSSVPRTCARASKRRQHEWLPSFIFGPFSPCPGLHGARTLKKRNAANRRRRRRQKAPETSERTKPVPPRSVFFP